MKLQKPETVKYGAVMITAVDAAILLDALDPSSASYWRAHRALDRARQTGRLVACELVWAEVSARFSSPDAFAKEIDVVGVEFEGLNSAAALEAGRIWRRFRPYAARRERIPADFLVGAHALVQTGGLLTYPRGFFGRYFRTLRIAPS